MISNVANILSIRPAAPASAAPSQAQVEQPSTTSEDTVEFSPLGRAMARAASESTMRIAQIHAIRAEIENGTYETPERIRGTVDRLLKFLA